MAHYELKRRNSILIINNKTKAVIVLKATEMPNLRLFPGYNSVKETGLKKYFGSPAARAHQKDNLIIVESEILSAEDKIQADKAEAKNAQLNKAQRVIKAQNEKLAKVDKTISGQAKQISDQAKIIKQLQLDMEEIKAAKE